MTQNKIAQRWRRMVGVVAVAALVLAGSTHSATVASDTEERGYEMARGRRGAVATDSKIATAIAVEVLRSGGNAVDAAVAAVFAIGVVRPEMCGIGGGGFLVYRSADGEEAALDFRERAPLENYEFGRGIFEGAPEVAEGVGHNVVGVPGMVAGMVAVHERYGTKPWADLIEPARVQAEDGFPVAPTTALHLQQRGNVVRYYPESSRVFLKKPVGDPVPGEVTAQTPELLWYEQGDILKLPDLAETLGRIQANPREFYEAGDGEHKTIADLIAEDFERDYGYPGGKGSLTLKDLGAYEAKWREPLVNTYRGQRIIAMPPPTSGGVATIEILNILENFDLDGDDDTGRFGADHLHYLAEAQKIAWADRAVHLGDPDHVDVPEHLTSKDYARERAAAIEELTAQEYGASDPKWSESHTSHVSVVDAEGNAVTTTCTIEAVFGSGVVVPGTGILLNSQLTDFDDPKSGTNNEPAPGKRPRSSSSPTIVVSDDRPVLVVGAAGGPNIIAGVVQAVINAVDFGFDIGNALHAPRIEARCTRDLLAPGRYTLCVESGPGRISDEVVDELKARGHEISEGYEAPGTYLVVNATGVHRSWKYAVSEPRSPSEEQGAGACCDRRR